MNCKSCAAGLLIVFASTLSFAEKFALDVYASKFDSIPIGIVDFKSGSGAVPPPDNEPGKVISNDLDFSGRFQVFRKQAFDSAAFARQGVGIYIDGEYSIEGSAVTLGCSLRDAASRTALIEKTYTGDVKHLRTFAHQFCNEIVKMIFGDRGIFESKIIFVRADGQKKDIAIMDFDGYNQRRLTNNNVINILPVWEDSLSMLYVSYLRGKPDIFKGSVLDGKSDIFIYSRSIQVSPDVSPVDGTVVYACSKPGNLSIFTCAADGTNVRQLTMNTSINTSPCWSPNGYQIAFTSDRSGNPSIYVMDADGANQHRLTFEGKYNDSPAWSPKGDKIAYNAMGDNNKFDIWVISPDGTNAKPVTSMPGNCEYPTWSPDGSLIAFVNMVGGRSDMWVVKPDGTKLHRVTTTGDVKMPNWSRF